MIPSFHDAKDIPEERPSSGLHRAHKGEGLNRRQQKADGGPGGEPGRDGLVGKGFDRGCLG